MIINGNARAGAFDLARHLSRADTNEHVSVMEVRGTAAGDLLGCFREMEGVAAGTRCKKPLYHANIDPACDYVMTDAQWAHAINELEAELGLTGQPRAVVKHTKHGRTHMHVVWARVDADRMRAIPDSHNYRKHETVARRLEKTFGHAHVQGVHAERQKDQPRPEARMTTAEGQQAQRSGIDPRDVTAAVTALWRQTDGARAFLAALLNAGYIPARGDRRGFVVIDPAGEVHSLARRIEGVTTAQLRKRMEGIDIDRLPTATEARVAVRKKADTCAETPPPDDLAAKTEKQEKAVTIDANTDEVLKARAMLDAVNTFLAERWDGYANRLTANLVRMEVDYFRDRAQALAEISARHEPKLPREEAMSRLRLDQKRREKQAVFNRVEPRPKLWRRVIEFIVPALRREREANTIKIKAAETATRQARYVTEREALDGRYQNHDRLRAQKDTEMRAAWEDERRRIHQRDRKDLLAFNDREEAAAYKALGTTEAAQLDIIERAEAPIRRMNEYCRNAAFYGPLKEPYGPDEDFRPDYVYQQPYKQHYAGFRRQLADDLKGRNQQRNGRREKIDTPRQKPAGPRQRQ